MPIYSFSCDNCETVVELMRPIVDRDALTICGECRRPLERLIDKPGMVWAPTSSSGGHKV